MLLAIDIGNSTMKFGLYNGAEITDRFSIHTITDYDAADLMSDRLSFLDTRIGRIDRIIVSSVVPDLNGVLTDVCLRLFKVSPIFVDASHALGMEVEYQPAESLGSDRLIAAYACLKKYGAPCVICSFGTATTIDAVSSAPAFLGGIITPGMGVMAEALSLKTARLPRVDISEPEAFLGTSTELSIRSGIFYGNIEMITGLVTRISAEITADTGHKPRVVATGGYARIIVPHVPAIDRLDENLILDGLRSVGEAMSSP